MKVDSPSGSYAVLEEDNYDKRWWYMAKPGQESYPEHTHHPNFSDHFIELKD
jgi:hypothetical protein